MRVHVKLAGVLKSLVRKEESDILTVELPEGAKVRDLIQQLYFKSVDLYKRVWNVDKNCLMPDIVIFVNGVDIRLLSGLDTELKDGDEVTLIAYIHGG